MISIEIQVIIHENAGRSNPADIYFSHQYFGFKTLEKSNVLKFDWRVAIVTNTIFTVFHDIVWQLGVPLGKNSQNEGEGVLNGLILHQIDAYIEEYENLICWR